MNLTEIGLVSKVERDYTSPRITAMRRAELEILRETNYELFALDPEEAFVERLKDGVYFPTENDLSALYISLNNKYFDGKLPDARIEWSTRMIHAGKCEEKQRIIRLGVAYHKHYPEDIIDTLKHEMIHLIHPNHGKDFKAEAKRIGASRYSKAYPGMLKAMKYIYECPECGEQYPSRKMLRNRSCGKCSRGRYNSRFKLRFVRRLK